MAQTHVISALVAKHSELEGLILAKQAEISSIQDILRHVDRTIKVFSPEFDLRTIRATRTNTRNALFAHGEIQRMVLNHLRCAKGNVTDCEIADEILKVKGIKVNDEVSAQTRKSVLSVIRRLERKGIVQVVKKENGETYWSLT